MTFGVIASGAAHAAQEPIGLNEGVDGGLFAGADSAAGGLVQVTDALGGQVLYGYDLGHHLTKVTDQAGHTTTYWYDV